LQELGERQSPGASISARCAESLASARLGLRRALDAIDERVGDEWVAAELRSALDELGRIVGAVYTDDILDRIFSRFCIGK
jgi:tRNA modification GTPase